MNRRNKYVWLFAFTDVAFLLLLTFTQFSRINSSQIAVAEMDLPVPQVAKNSGISTLPVINRYTRLVVDTNSEAPFRIDYIENNKQIKDSGYLTREELEKELKSIHGRKQEMRLKTEPRPIIAPHPESYSGDLLYAASLVGKIWDEEIKSLVRPIKEDNQVQ
ncbi:MAG: hypothetical protein HY754_01610 [Nitrospirae bacterium]|nr:hypothetical protein [Nitrospirota bacterium]